ncbi:hypothetical protein RXV95_06725 [Novosphingobium sp. ZN18A2]|uniref:hypothetical protein n=1 Tax=Novosphingobium sp. ZN18A2 TaxID=3079861 RepID=UPI0030D3404B
MQHDTALALARTPRRRLSTGERLGRAIRVLAGPRAEILDHSETPWASVTFAGSRHAFTLSFDGCAVSHDGENFIAALPDHEFTLPGTLVADATVCRVDHRMVPAPRLVVRIELLLLDES